MEGLLGIWEEFVNIVTYGNSLEKAIFSKIRIKFSTDKVTLIVKDSFIKDWIEKSYLDKVNSIYSYYSLKVEVVVDSSNNPISSMLPSFQKEVEDNVSKGAHKVKKAYREMSKKIEKTLDNVSKVDVISNHEILEINPRYTFNNFVIGSSNDLAYYSCLNVAREPGNNFNPLFVYGGVGLGKTHLLSAIAHEILSRSKLKKVVYVTSEQFISDFFESVSKKNLSSFRIKYREADVLLLDDVQFFKSSMKQTLDELFHTFNKLFNDKKQMVFSSDRGPKNLIEITDRLRSRFGSGLIVEIKKPDFETRVKIVNKKFEDEKFRATEEIKVFIAENIKNSVRDLESAVVKVIAFYSFKQTLPTSEVLRVLLKDLIYEDSRIENTYESKYTFDDIVNAVGKYYSIKPSEIYVESRQENLLLARQIIMYLAKKLISTSFSDLGEKFGKSHTTAMRSVLRIENLIKSNTTLKEQVKEILILIKSQKY